MKTGLLLCLFLVVFSASAHADKKTDSLENLIRTSKEDTVLLKAHSELCRRVRNTDPQASLEHGKIAMALAIKLKRDKDLAKIYNNLGTVYGNLGSRLKGYEYYRKAFDLHTKLGDKVNAYVAWYNIGLMKSDEGKFTEAMQYYVDAKKVFEEARDSNQLILPVMGIGALYAKLGKYDESLESFLAARKLIEKQGDKRKLSTCLNNLASSYAYKKDFEKSLETFKEALYVHQEMGDMDGVAMVMYNMATPLIELGRFEDALELIDSSLVINTQRGNRNDMAICYVNKAAVLKRMGRKEQVLDFLGKATAIATELDHKELLSDIYNSYYLWYSDQGDYKKALEYYQLHVALHDTLINQQLRGVNEVEKEYEREMKDRQIELINKEKEFEEYRAMNTFIIGGLALLALVVIVFVLFQRNKVRKKANVELSALNAIILQKNKDITDSIGYASRIQEALLSSREMKSKIFPESFVLFLPRDVVSGDFYWFAEKGGRKIMAAVDCTGHGVPGAFMSMIGNAFLNGIILEKGIVDPGQILDRLNERVMHSLKQDSVDGGSHDGMDASVCVFESNLSRCWYAGANNPLWVLRKGRQEALIYNADKQPIGSGGRKPVPFTTQTIDLEKGDMVYLFSDGYPDQFGGDKNKKLGYKKFREYLASVSFLNPSQQEDALIEKFNAWKTGNEQTDDVLVIGIRV